MNYRSLLVLLDDSESCAARVEMAINRARDLDCHLVGLAPTGLVEMGGSSQPAPALEEFAARAWDHLRERASQAANRFRDECRVAGLKSYEAVVDEDDKAISLVAHAHCSDLVVLSQADAAARDHRAVRAMVEQVVLHSARPTLIAPTTGRFSHVGDRVLVAWNDSREAARAISDALPILCHSSHVQLVHWRHPEAPDDAALRGRLDAAQRWLMWHGVPCEVIVEATELPFGGAMLSRAAAMQADLLVMGAYGHSLLAERLLGGATHTVLAASPLPVLMSH